MHQNDVRFSFLIMLQASSLQLYLKRDPDVVLMSILLTLNRFHTLFWCFHCWLWISKYGLDRNIRTIPQRKKCLNTEFFLVHKVTIKNAKFFVLIVSCLRTRQQKILHWTTNGTVFNKMVSHDFNMTSFGHCCHNWLACICFCACIYLLSQIFCLACYRLRVEQWLAFHWDIGDIV